MSNFKFLITPLTRCAVAKSHILKYLPWNNVVCVCDRGVPPQWLCRMCFAYSYCISSNSFGSFVTSGRILRLPMLIILRKRYDWNIPFVAHWKYRTIYNNQIIWLLSWMNKCLHFIFFSDQYARTGDRCKISVDITCLLLITALSIDHKSLVLLDCVDYTAQLTRCQESICAIKWALFVSIH